MIRARALLMCAIASTLIACESEVQGGEITVKNSMSGEFSTVTVAGGGSRYILESQDYAVLSNGTRDITFEYNDGKRNRYYRVRCPSSMNKRITIRLIDVHSNRIDGGCETVEAR